MASRVTYRQRRGPVISEATARRWLERRTREVERRAKQLAPDGMKRHIWREVDAREGRVICNHPAVSYYCRGTAPHVIRPRRKQALKFNMRGDTIFAAKVNHPGQPARPFLVWAMEQTR